MDHVTTLRHRFRVQGFNGLDGFKGFKGSSGL